MRLLGLDLETTGFDTANDRVTEIGAVLWEVETKRPLVTQSCFLVDEGILQKMENPEVSGMMSRICGITREMLTEFGRPPAEVFGQLATFIDRHRPDFIVAHNGENFDRPLLGSELNRHKVNVVQQAWIDTRTDIPFAVEPDSRKLKHLALDAGFINPFAHRAVFDVLTMLRVLSNYDIHAIIEYAKIPFVTVRAKVGYDDRQLAKDQRYSWEKLGEKTYPKCWVKRIKENKLATEIQACKFEVVKID